MNLVEQFTYEQRKRKKCSVCDRIRLTTRAMWQVDLPTGTTLIEVFLCNDCLADHDR